MRVKIKFIARFPFAKMVDASFLEKPSFDYVLKPLGTDSFGFDVNYVSPLKRIATHTLITLVCLI
jgi:Ca2+-dependent lipid-binding protein